MKKNIYLFIIAIGLPFLGFSQPSNYVLLDGTESILVSNSSDINLGTFRDRTVEFWFKADDVSHTDREVIYEEGAQVRGINFWVEDGYIYLGIYNDDVKDGTPNGFDQWFGTWFRAPISNGQWYHLALVLNDADNTGYPSTLNEKLEWYLGGILQDTGHGGPLYSHSGDIRVSSTDIGVFPSTPAIWSNDVYEATASGHNEDITTSHFNGAVGLLRIWNSARTESQINDNKNTPITTIGTGGLVAYLNGNLVTDTGGDNGGSAGNGTPMPPASISTYIWNGTTSTDWSIASNWENGDVAPLDGQNVEISKVLAGDNDPILPSSALFFGDLTISPGNTLNVDKGYSVEVNGELVNEGTISVATNNILNTRLISGNSQILISPNATMSSTKIENTGDITSEGAINISDILNNSTVNGAINLQPGSVLTTNNLDLKSPSSIVMDDATATITNSLSNEVLFIVDKKSEVTVDGSLSNSGTFTIQSGSDGTGSLITNGTINNTTGTIEVERYINEGTWQLLSSPTDNEESEVVHGSFLNYFNEADGDFYGIKERDYNLVEGDGYVVKWKDEFASGTNPLVFSQDKPNTGDVSIPVNVTPEEENDPVDGFKYSNTYFDLPVGFNLVGNPYPSRINWNMLYARNSGSIDNAYYRYSDDPGDSGKKGNDSWHAYLAGDVATADIDSIISIGQGFGVILKGNTTAPSLIFSNAVRTHNTGTVGFGKRTETSSQSFNLIASSNGMSDDVNFRINKNSTTDYDGHFDAYKLNSFGNTPTPSFISADNKKLAICQQPESESVDLGFNMAISGEVTFSVSNVSDFTELVLEDKQEGTFTDLLKSSYSFTYSDEDAETGRFTIHFNQETLSEVEGLTGLKIYSNTSSVVLNSNESLNNVELELYNISGQKVL